MSGFVIDTNVISEFAKLEPNSNVIDWFDHVPSGKRRSNLEHWLEKRLPAWFRAKFAPGNRIHCRSMIAATAIKHKLSIVTRNLRDFEGLRIEIVNPWEDNA